MYEEQIDVWLLPFLDRVHLLDRVNQARQQAFNGVALAVVESLCGQEDLGSGNRTGGNSLPDHCRRGKKGAF